VQDIKVILVSLGTHFFWNIATVRAIIPGQLPDESILQPISPGFAQYPEKSFEFIVGRAESLDPDRNVVLISTAGGNVVQNYDMLVLATGADSIGDTPWKPKGSYDETKKKLHEVQERIKTARSILVAGAGVTGIEVAGELGYEYGKTKKIILVC
jgi:NADH dehydrogenase FAD-containing subunit